MKVAFVMGSGGHTKRAIMLANKLPGDKMFIVPFESELTKKKVGNRYYSVVSPRFKAKANIPLTIVRTLFLFLHAIVLLAVTRPHIVISTGSGLSYPVLLMAQMLRIRTVYIESPSRVYSPSIAGRMLMGKVDIWLSSWPELANRYSTVEFMGMIA